MRDVPELRELEVRVRHFDRPCVLLAVSLAALMATSGCTSSSGLRTEADVTEREIATYREGVRLGCKNQASEPHDPRADDVCNCALEAIDTAIGAAGWRKAAFHGWRREFEAERQVMAPAMPGIDACTHEAK